MPIWNRADLRNSLVVAGVYFVAARLSLLLAFENTTASPVWPPAGIGLAAILLLGKRIWPGILVGAFCANAVVLLGDGRTDAVHAVLVAALTGIGNTLEAVAGAYLLARFTQPPGSLGRARDVFLFTGASLAMCLISSAVGPTAQCVFGLTAWGLFGAMWLTWWLGDVAGVLIVAPVILSWRRGSRRLSRSARIEAAVLFLSLAATGELLFGEWLPPGAVKSLPYFMVPFLLWAAYRFGLREASTAVALAASFAVWGTIRGRGPFAGQSLNESLLLLQAFVCVMAIMALVLAAAVAERRRAQGALTRQAEELKRSNSELQQFAYVVSHDLKAPLRSISSLANWIAEDYSDALDGEGLENLRLLVGRTHRMNNLIEGILQYSRAGRAATEMESIDTGPVSQSLIDALGPPNGVAVTISGPMPTITYDRTHYEQVTQNLIDNAVKHLGSPSGQVTLACRELADQWEFSVRDSGVGIPEEHFERIFQLFQTLKPKDQVESTGIGLSLVKRIVERYGGTVRLQSTVGAGSEFFFTVPKQIVRHDGDLIED